MDRDRRPRTVEVAMVAGALATSSACGRGSTPTDAGGGGKGGLEIVASKATYEPGEIVDLTLILTNRGATPCRVSDSPEGMLTVSSMTRDGKAIRPELLTRAITCTTGHYSHGLRAVAPGASAPAHWESELSGATDVRRMSLVTARVLTDTEDLSIWPVNQPGRYAMTVSYVVPPSREAPDDACLRGAEHGSCIGERTWTTSVSLPPPCSCCSPPPPMRRSSIAPIASSRTIG